ncbi:MAG: aminomethyl-transferring glycine dehydrogenase subunit GcvPB [Desulfosarcina sp.]|nr:aminomethyl-transferring glycine dehydrogenase subunit GcvPB [Desulfobacterales bacterium]
MNEFVGTQGLILNEPLLWERGRKGRTAYSLPRRDVDPAPLDDAIAGPGPDFPDLSEVEIVRHYTRLSQWNYGVDSGMYPLGSCTMKYNPKTNERQASLVGFSGAHPLVPGELCQGALQLIYELEHYLADVAGLDAVSGQPAAGAQGELAGMLIFATYHRDQGRARSKILIPDTAHGTNPASAALCGFKSVPLATGEDGVLTPEAVEALMDEDTAGLMVTNPNTLGLFETNIRPIADIVHAQGGLIYADGANMNAVMGIVDFGRAGADVLHINLHKTFSTPHGGGGPGAGPGCVTKELEPFLPAPRVIRDGKRYRLSEDFPKSIGKLHAFYGNFSILVRAYSYILSLGPQLKDASRLAVLNANYIKEKLKDVYHLPFDKPCMHECVFTDRNLEPYKITTLDVAKRLIDYGFHPPTIYFPLVVHGAIMIEPTESESREDIDQFIATMRVIAREARENPDLLTGAPRNAKVRRLDETTAARKPCLRG